MKRGSAYRERLYVLTVWTLVLAACLAFWFIVGWGVSKAIAAPRPDNPPTHWVPGKGDQSWQWKYQVWMPPVYQRIAHCEGGTRPPQTPNWSHDSGIYQGAFGFYYGTWDSYKPVASWPGNAAQASPWQQYRTALRVQADVGFYAWGCYRNSWVRGSS